MANLSEIILRKIRKPQMTKAHKKKKNKLTKAQKSNLGVSVARNRIIALNNKLLQIWELHKCLIRWSSKH